MPSRSEEFSPVSISLISSTKSLVIFDTTGRHSLSSSHGYQAMKGLMATSWPTIGPRMQPTATPRLFPTASASSTISQSASPPYKIKPKRIFGANGRHTGQRINMPNAYAPSTWHPLETRSSNFFDSSPKPIVASSYNYGQLMLASTPTYTDSTPSIPPYAPFAKYPKPSTIFFFIVENITRNALPYGTASTPSLSTKLPSSPPRHTDQPSWATSTIQDASPTIPAESRQLHLFSVSHSCLSFSFSFSFHLLPSSPHLSI